MFVCATHLFYPDGRERRARTARDTGLEVAILAAAVVVLPVEVAVEVVEEEAEVTPCADRRAAETRNGSATRKAARRKGERSSGRNGERRTRTDDPEI